MNVQIAAEIAALPSIQALFPLRKRFFALAYIASENGAKAVREAGYKAAKPRANPRSLGELSNQESTQAGRLLRDAAVSAAVREGIALKWSMSLMPAHEVLARTSRIARHDHRKLLAEAHRDTALQSLDDDTAEAVQGVKIRKEYDRNGSVKAETTEYKVASKLGALELLAKYHRLLASDSMASDFGAAFADALDRKQKRDSLRDSTRDAEDAMIAEPASVAGDDFAQGAA